MDTYSYLWNEGKVTVLVNYSLFDESIDDPLYPEGAQLFVPFSITGFVPDLFKFSYTGAFPCWTFIPMSTMEPGFKLDLTLRGLI